MRIGRIASPDGVAFASIDGELGEPSEMTAREIAEHPFGTPTFTGRSWPLADVRLLAPILASKVVCVGKNYADHIAEMGGRPPADPVIFLKPNTAIIGPNTPIRLPAGGGGEVAHENAKAFHDKCGKHDVVGLLLGLNTQPLINRTKY
ncbi:Rv2993c-like domain-containing protein, partial [Mycobacterium tuberculosis]